MIWTMASTVTFCSMFRMSPFMPVYMRPEEIPALETAGIGGISTATRVYISSMAVCSHEWS